MTKLELFQEALFHICLASDTEQMLDGQPSIQLDQLLQDGFPFDVARKHVIAEGRISTEIAQAYINCFETFGYEGEFDKWSQVDKNFERAMQQVVLATIAGAPIIEEEDIITAA